MSKLSVNEFRKLLKEEIEKIASAHGWNISNNQERGYAFQYWLGSVITAFEVGFTDADVDDACLFSKDLKADLFFEDADRQHLLICQAKYQGFDKVVDEGEVNDFFNRHNHFANRAWILKHGSERAVDLLADYGEKLTSGYSATYYFFSTGAASDRIVALAEATNASYASRGIPVRCDLFDFGRLKDYYVRSLSLEESGPSEVVFRLPADRFFEKADPLPTIVAVLKGNEFRALYQRFKEALYVWNIRGYLGNRGINSDIFKTAQEDPEHFFYYNNGVSAICTNYEIRDGNELRAENFQIINGAQTISTLANAPPNTNIDVLFRLTRTKSVKTEKGINRDIIQFNNTQNAIKVSDFRSNDEIQVWLEQRFKTRKATSVVPDISYLRKRAVGRKGSGQGLRLEELAKIRYAFLVEPTLIHSSPKSLWSLKEDDGVYEVAFGVDGELLPAWSEQTFDDTLLAIAFYLRVDTEAKERARKSPDLRFLKRLRFHALALAGVYVREKAGVESAGTLLHNKTAFGGIWSSFWSVASGSLIDVYETAITQGSTMFAFVRSEDRFDQMRKRLRLRLAATE